jgi:hypothetical protein
MTMTTAATQVDLEPPMLDEPTLAEDIVDECGLGPFPASDPPSWWAAGLGHPHGDVLSRRTVRRLPV